MPQTELEDLIESEWQNYITSLAMEKVQKAFRGNALMVFEMANQGKSFSDISSELSLTGNTANVLYSRVKKRFINEIKGLIFELEGRDNE